MKKWLLAVLVLFAFSMISYAADFGIGVKGGIGQNDPKEMKRRFQGCSSGDSCQLTKGPGVFSIEGFFEGKINSTELEITGINKAGIKVGYDYYMKNKFKNSSYDGKETTYGIPLTLYFKADNGLNDWSSYLGIGITWFNTETFFKNNFGSDEYAYQKKVIPHIAIGGEYRYTEFFAIGIDVKFNINASQKVYGHTISDRSGFQGLGVVRFYF